MQAEYDISASIVAHHNDETVLTKAIQSFLNTKLNVCLYVVDNSETDSLKKICTDRRIIYIFNNNNIGFGSAHNIAIRKSAGNSTYHLILNPDVYFDGNVMEHLFEIMEKNKDIGVISPKIKYPDGALQYSCRLLPSPMDVISRRLPFRELLFKEKLHHHELRFSNYDKTMEIPFLLGCFLLVRSEAFVKAGMFDERFFMYNEDLDLTRRIGKMYKTVFYPGETIFHTYEKGSAKKIKLLLIHIESMFKYFNKWGWFFDAGRKKINADTLWKIKMAG